MLLAPELVARLPLNSNLILLIPCHFLFKRSVKKPLNSNLILLIPDQCHSGLSHRLDFKFQSDSINTAMPSGSHFRLPALNSNLILLIPCPATFYLKGAWKNFKFQSDSINTARLPRVVPDLYHFKFQSDSINTSFKCHFYSLQFSLNSNLILLIPLLVYDPIPPSFFFKFQSDSINTTLLFL